MLVAFLIMLREGLEAALIVGIIASYLRHAGKGEWMPLVWIGAASAALICLGTGLVLDILSAEVPQRQQELFEALVGLVAVAMLTAMAFWMRRAGRRMKGELQGRVAEALGTGSGAALILMVFLAVAREGLESVFFLLALVQQSESLAVPLGALLGLLASVVAGIAIAWGGLRLNLARFFRWTGVFILLVAAGLAAGSLRALHEAGLWNGLQQVAFDLSHSLPMDGMPGALLAGMLGYVDRPSIGEFGLWLLFILMTLPLFLTAPRGARA
ncbi:FTR1 family protein [Acetobacteraceae bacterium H6797]|nr:FTR1 family protein [Acetobacteraceae bacterium H6797]